MRVWHYSDGRAGHDRQARALIGALAVRTEVSVNTFAPLSAGAALRAVAARCLAPGHPDPDLVLGAGHDTHAALLAARRVRGGRTIVLMRPSLPLSWFDLCVIPRHDRPPARENVIETLGPLSPLAPAEQRGHKGVVLVGGPSRHFHWSDRAVWEQIEGLVAACPAHSWRLSPSRRTPAGFLGARPEFLHGRVEATPLEDQPPGWLERVLPRAAQVWVTPDSLSMIFDALAAGVPCGVLDLPARPRSRVAQALTALAGEGRVLRFDPRRPGDAPPARAPLREADRVAEVLLQRWDR